MDSYRSVLNRFDTTLSSWKAWNYIAFTLILLKKIRKREKSRWLQSISRYCKLLLLSICCFSCTKNPKGNSLFPKDGIKEFRIVQTQDTLLISKVCNSNNSSVQIWKLYKKNGIFYSNHLGQKELIMSNTVSMNSMYKYPSKYCFERVVIEHINDTLISTSIFTKDVQEHLDIKIVYNHNYEIKFIQHWLVFITYKP